MVSAGSYPRRTPELNLVTCNSRLHCEFSLSLIDLRGSYLSLLDILMTLWCFEVGARWRGNTRGDRVQCYLRRCSRFLSRRYQHALRSIHERPTHINIVNAQGRSDCAVIRRTKVVVVHLICSNCGHGHFAANHRCLVG